MNTPHLIDTGLNWLFQTTWQAALLAVAIAIITRVFRRKLSPPAVSLLWMLVFIRLIMPVLPGSPVSIFALFTSEPAPLTPSPVSFAAADFSHVVLPAEPVTIDVPPPAPAWTPRILIASWLVGTGSILGLVILQTIRFSRRLNRRSQPADDRTSEMVETCCQQRSLRPPEILLTDLIATPAIFGVIRPRLLIPPAILAQLSAIELRSVILHELEHLRRRHLLSDWLFTFIKAVHWFNPAAWWSHRQIRAARELICDQAVLARLDEETSRQYGMTMLALASGLRPGPIGVPVAAFARDYKLLKQRIEAIASRRRYLAWLGVLLVIAVSVIFLTKPQPVTAQEPPKPATQPATPPASAPAEDPATTTMRDVLNRPLPELRFEAIPFADVIDFLRDVSGANITVHWKALEDAKIGRTAQVSARLRDVKLSKALEVILDSVAGESGKVSYVADQGVITISTVEDLKKVAAPPPYPGVLKYPDAWPAQPATRPAAAAGSQNVPDLARRAQDLLSQGKYDEALAAIDEILTQEPTNANAQNLRPLIQDRAAIQRQRQMRDQYMRGPISTLPNSMPAATQPAAQSAENAAAAAQLEKVLPEVRFDAIPFADVMDFMRDITGANIFVNWRALEAAGIARTTPVTARLREVTFSKALETILRDVGGGKVQLGFTIDEGVITISTADDLQSNVVTNVYDIRDLVPLDKDVPEEQRKQLVEGLVTLIQATVARETWRDNGGKLGSIRELSGQLIVTQTPENQQILFKMLTQLRETRAVQITTEAVMIELTKGQVAAVAPGDPARQWIPIDDFQISVLRRSGVRTVAAPRITTFNGQTAAIGASNNDLAFNLSIASTVSQDRKSTTMTLTWMGPPGTTREDGKAVVGKQTTFTLPDGATALTKLADAGPDRERWLAIKSTIIIQREREQEQFPLLGSQPPPAQP